MARGVSRRGGFPGVRAIARSLDYGVCSAFRRLPYNRRVVVAASPAPAIAQAVQSARNYMSGGTQSSGNTRRFRRERSTGVFAGRRRKLRGRPLAVKGKRKMFKMDRLGVRFQWEEGLDYSDPKLIAVGHALPLKKMFEVFTRSLFRNLLRLTNHDFEHWGNTPKFASDANPTIGIEIFDDKGQSYTVTSVMNWGTFESMWNSFDAYLWTNLIGQSPTVASGFQPGYQFQRAFIKLGNYSVVPPYFNVDAAELYLGGAVVQMNYVQSMKVQNVTPAADGGAIADQDSDIFNVPLTGKMYECTGTSLKFKVPIYTNLSPNTAITAGNDGVCSAIIRNRLNLGPLPSEPPQAYEFKNCKKFEKVYMQPGNIKTSVITNSFGVNINKFILIMNTCIQQDGGAAVGSNFKGHDTPFGKLRCMILEKAIGNILGTEADIRVRLEVDTKLQCYLKCKKQLFSAPAQGSVL